MQSRKDTTRLLTAIDLLNKKFGKDAVSIGMLSDANKDVAKIAFSRIPDMDKLLNSNLICSLSSWIFITLLIARNISGNGRSRWNFRQCS
jgi:hypothetical protein